MIGFDTNVLLRFYLTDPTAPNQSEKARELVETALEKNILFYVSQVVLCETSWVLEAAYRIPKRQLVAFLFSVVQDAPFLVEGEEQVFKAIRHLSQTRADFADCLIAANAKARGIRKTYTFGRWARDISGMEWID